MSLLQAKGEVVAIQFCRDPLPFDVDEVHDFPYVQLQHFPSVVIVVTVVLEEEQHDQFE